MVLEESKIKKPDTYEKSGYTSFNTNINKTQQKKSNDKLENLKKQLDGTLKKIDQEIKEHATIVDYEVSKFGEEE